MFFPLDPQNGIPLYEQIVRQLSYAVADEVVRAGELVPSVRQLAQELAINPNTVARAFRQLQDDQVLEAVRGKGLAVASGARDKCRRRRQFWIRQRLRQVLDDATRSGLAADELLLLVQDELQRSSQGTSHE